ncbi:MAG TPA: hypothetical protein VGO47_01860, partial [Chlamydiales bacterium]|nr:hypothetical protein [Chlamydiales bacterium]
QATLADGQAQQSALNQEANIRGNMAYQSIVEGGSTIAGELGGIAVDSHIGNSAEAQTSQENLKLAESWETRLSGKKPADAVIRQEVNVGDKCADHRASDVQLKDAPKKTIILTADEVEAELKNVRVKDEHGNMLDSTKDLTERQKAAIDQAVTAGSPALDKLLKQARKGVKQYRSQTESTGNTQQRKSQQFKDIVRALSLSGKVTTDLFIKNYQNIEADQKLAESQQRYLSDTNGTLMRQGSDVAGNLTNHIQNIHQAQKEMYESNRA